MRKCIIYLSLALTFLSEPSFASEELHGIGYVGFSPKGRSERFKDDFFLTKDRFLFIWGCPLYFRLNNKSHLFMHNEGVVMKLRYYNSNNIIKTTTGYELSTAFSYGYSLIKDDRAIPFLGLGWYGYDQPDVKWEQGQREIGKRKLADHLGWEGGLKTKINRRINLDYHFNSARRLRHRITTDIKVGSDFNMGTQDFDIGRCYLFFGASLDERKSHLLFFGLKLDMVAYDTVAKR